MAIVPSKALAKELAADAGKFFSLFQRVLRLTDSQDKQGKQIEAQAAEIKSLRERIIVLESREPMLQAQAREAAAQATAHIVTDIARRLGYLEGGRK